ncbi:M24 family metallopeptidase [Ferviditalea candida]|uniref:Xaa-Pro peptidase family protein n=1 Tax=Ferviditalea candida TaxID=3108399 RepID=A0ABU5ZI14_9BACL|nr:Xaa-Pro peptidase family protein [Paenibacillaceae bacterium T2]
MNEFNDRIRRLQERMRQEGTDGFLVTQNVDLYYFTGSMQIGYLFVPVEGEPRFYVRRSLQRAQVESAFPAVGLGSFRSFGDKVKGDFSTVFSSGKSPVIATEFDVLPVQVFQRLEAAFGAVEWKDGSMAVRELRMIKSEQEIALLRKSAQIADQALDFALSRLKEGATELELVSDIEYRTRQLGHMGMIRMRGYNQELVTGMVGSGSAISMPTGFDGPAGGQGLGPAFPQGSARRAIAANEPILMDIGCMIDGYVSDQTRTVVIGELPEKLQKAYEVSEQILRKAESMLKPGTICEDLYVMALEHAKDAGLEEHFMGYGEDQVKFLGHGIGLEMDELPVLAKGFKYPLQPGMVIAVEPKFTFPGTGVIGIENTYAITDDGFEKLTLTREGIIQV